MTRSGAVRSLAALGFALCLGGALSSQERRPEIAQEPNTWVKRSPTKEGPPSPGLAYEASLAYDPRSGLVLRWAGHNQGGGGEQGNELWTFDPDTARWALKEPNTAPPGVCCAQQNVFDPAGGRFLRFAAFSGNHGWQWFREIYLSNSSVWSYDPAANTWRDLRTLPAPRTGPLRCAAWDADSQVVVVFGGEGVQEGTVVFDPYVNAWTRMKPARQPEFRSGGNMAYDEARKLHVLFGAQFQDDPHTWAYDLRANEWRDLKPARQPPTDRNDAVLAYDRNSQLVVAFVRVVDGSDGKEVTGGHVETWSFDAGANAWKRLEPPREPGGWHNRRRLLTALPDRNLLLLENYVNPADRLPDAEREQQVWTFRVAPTKATPLPPPDVALATAADGTARLSWKAVPGAAGYAVYRGEGEQPWRVEYRKVAEVKGDTRFEDRGLNAGKVRFYSVRSVDREGREGGGVKVRTQPRLVEDVTASVLSPTEVRLSWRAPPGEDIVGYHVERAAVEVYSEDQIARLKKDTPPLDQPSVGAVKAVGPFVRLTRRPLPEPAFADTGVDLSRPAAIEGEAVPVTRLRADQLDEKGKPYRFAVYAYRVRAVNALGVEGGPSPYALTIPSAPHWLFSQEAGAACRLKWAANPEQGVKGYRVYRMEGPKLNGPGQKVTRLNAEPLAATRFTDDKAGTETARYWVVAVDALGQEGYPSAPAWHQRQFRKFYEPFVGEWHQ
jgi:hypothetical protein